MIAKCSKILNSYTIGSLVSTEHERFLIDNCFVHHLKYQTKFGKPVSHLFVNYDKYHGKCFYIRYTDGSSDDISIKQSLDPSKPIDILRKAARQAVDYQIDEFKERTFKPGLVCPVTNAPIGKNCHVDHVAPKTFDQLVFDHFGERMPDIIESSSDYAAGSLEFEDDGEAWAWRNFHEANAVLRLTTPKGNWSLKKHKVVKNG